MVGDKQYLYIYNDRFIKTISSVLVGEDPIEVAAYCGDNEDAVCSPMDVSFHLSQNLSDMVYKTTWDLVTRSRMAARLKVLNNDSPTDNTTDVPKTK